MFDSKKKKAIKALEAQKAKIDNPEHYNDVIWVAQTADIVKKYIGEKSALYNVILRFKFSILDTGMLTKQQKQYEFAQKERDAKKLVENCIEYINTNGVYKEPIDNPLSKIKANWLVAFVFTGGSIIFSAGWFFANLNNRNDMKDLQNSSNQMQIKINELRDSIRLNRTPNGVPDEQAKTPNKKGKG